MEIELKYSIPTPEIADKIWTDRMFFRMEEDDSREEICFDAKYYDTVDHDLSKNDIAYRVRKEGCRWVAALKWSGESEGALHTRNEINVPVLNEKPDATVFYQSEIGDELKSIIGDKLLGCLMETKFRRRRFRIDSGTGIFELSIDNGWILTPFGREPILEVELELFSGDTEELKEYGEMLCEKYNLRKEENSKYARGMNIIANA